MAQAGLRHPLLRDEALERLEQVLRLDRLGEVRVEASLQAALHVLVKGVGRKRDDGDLGCVLAVHGANRPRGLEAIHLGHAHVHENRIVVSRLVLRQLVDTDVPALEELVASERVYRYLPTYLFEKQFDDMHKMIRELYGSCFPAKESLILGVEVPGDGSICGLAEYYGLRDDAHKISVGYRFLERSWGRGVASKTVHLMVEYLYTQTDTQIITASTMIEDLASARVLEKNDFIRTARGVEEDWGYDQPTIADKWFC